MSRWSELEDEITELQSRLKGKQVVMGILRKEIVEINDKINSLKQKIKDLGIH